MLDQVDMNKKYKQLDGIEREMIGIMKRQGCSLRNIAMKIDRSASTISRELKRNLHEHHGYLPIHANELSKVRLSKSRMSERIRDEETRNYVIEKLKLKWSPELISGRMKLELENKKISHEAIYQWIYNGAKNHIKDLTWSRNERMKKGKGRKRKFTHIPHRTSIKKRPLSVNNRKVAGHWEADLAVSKKSKSVLHVITERKTRYTKLTVLDNRTTAVVSEATVNRLRYVPRKLKKSITYDNGPENAEHMLVNRILGTDSYFCRPYHSWDKGTVENTIGLVRRSLPKNTDFKNVSSGQIKTIEKWLNSRPRKCLRFLTPYEVFKAERCT